MDELHDQVRSTNVKYIGTLAYNRRSGKVSNPREHNIAADWVINDGAILRLLSRVLFNEAQAERARRTKRYEPAELLELLRTCHKRHGDVTSQIIDGDPLMQAPRKYFTVFGSLLTAYELADLPATTRQGIVEKRRLLLALRKTLFAEVCLLAGQAGALVEIAKAHSHWSSIAKQLCASMWCRSASLVAARRTGEFYCAPAWTSSWQRVRTQPRAGCSTFSCFQQANLPDIRSTSRPAI